MKIYSLKFKIIFVFCIAVFIFAFLFLILGGQSGKNQDNKLDSFAKCLTDKGAIMYGNYNCSHCQDEKDAFGSSFKYVFYVECTQNPKECVAQNISTVPTWIFSDGRRFVGKQGLEKLSEESGCPLPQASPVQQLQ